MKLHIAEPSVVAGEQRYDLFFRERFATNADLGAALARLNAGSTRHQKAAAFALRELTGVEPGPTSADWLRIAGR